MIMCTECANFHSKIDDFTGKCLTFCRILHSKFKEKSVKNYVQNDYGIRSVHWLLRQWCQNASYIHDYNKIFNIIQNISLKQQHTSSLQKTCTRNKNIVKSYLSFDSTRSQHLVPIPLTVFITRHPLRNDLSIYPAIKVTNKLYSIVNWWKRFKDASPANSFTSAIFRSWKPAWSWCRNMFAMFSRQQQHRNRP